jgi:hypothetical protein
MVLASSLHPVTILASVFILQLSTALSSLNKVKGMCARVSVHSFMCVCACMCVHVCAFVRAGVHVCVRACTCVHNAYVSVCSRL